MILTCRVFGGFIFHKINFSKLSRCFEHLLLADVEWWRGRAAKLYVSSLMSDLHHQDQTRIKWRSGSGHWDYSPKVIRDTIRCRKLYWVSIVTLISTLTVRAVLELTASITKRRQPGFDAAREILLSGCLDPDRLFLFSCLGCCVVCPLSILQLYYGYWCILNFRHYSTKLMVGENVLLKFGRLRAQENLLSRLKTPSE